MGAIKSICSDPKFTKKLVELSIFKKNKLKVFDIGSRGGFESHWRNYQDQVEIIGFEADEEESQRLNKKGATTQSLVLGKSNKTTKFYLTNYAPSSGLYEPDASFLARLPDLKNLKVVKTKAIKSITLDSFINSKKLLSPDFLKIDVEGAELDVLKGGVLTLKSVIGISVEAEFYPTHIDQPVFSDIDSFLRTQGFFLYDLSINRHARKSFSPYMYSPNPGSTDFGQVIWGQAIYFKDPILEIGKKKSFWTKDRILKISSLMELVSLQDCAIEILQYPGTKKILKNVPTKDFIDLLTKSALKKDLKYNDYVKSLKNTSAKKTSEQVIKRVFLYKNAIPLALRKVIYNLLLELRNFIDIIIKTT